jgi:RNA polymerase sigma-70 factor (ECF subfamily)
LPLGANPPGELATQLDGHRAALLRHCHRVLGSSFEAEDAVQETLVRAWRGVKDFRGRSAVRTWLYRIATNVCLDMLAASQRRARPASFPEVRSPDAVPRPAATAQAELARLSGEVDDDADPADVAVLRESVRLALLVALRQLPPRQRAVLILRDVLRWKADEVATLLDTSVPAVNSALQRARSTVARTPAGQDAPVEIGDASHDLLRRYVHAFEHHRIDTLTDLLREDAGEAAPRRPGRGRRLGRWPSHPPHGRGELPDAGRPSRRG